MEISIICTIYIVIEYSGTCSGHSPVNTTTDLETQVVPGIYRELKQTLTECSKPSRQRYVELHIIS
jgi:hypothetical protein